MADYKHFHDYQILELKNLIKEFVQEELSRFIPYYKRMLKEEEQNIYVDVKVLCSELCVSRQTVSNWEKGKVKGVNIEGLFRKKGGRKEYNLSAIKQNINQKDRF